MIYTVTLNPSIDYIVQVEHLKIGHLNRVNNDVRFPGGKGINVSRVLKRLNVNSMALGFIGGFTGEFISDFLRKEDVETDFTRVSGESRINIKLKTDTETEINGNGPEISSENYQDLLNKIKKLKENDILVLSGSIPKSMPAGFYEQVTEFCGNNNIKAVVDTSGSELLNAVKHRPFLIKPNHHELGEIFSEEIDSFDKAAFYGKKLAQAGAQHVIVSMAGEGAVLCTDGKTYKANVPKGCVVNSTGAGDSVVAGFIGKYVTAGMLAAFRYSLAAGSATAFSADLCRQGDIENLLGDIEIEEMKGGLL
ncbi:fructose-1-phosphate kinase [Bacillus sp. OV322]|uniref:1-phosphofructokinase n=1 Tax=Bacillus sp. OV322 TaxID=1882764 RepID=UPI0008E8BA83|nr:1-phosphofructokinase [Bacillus sp. OV322]SFC77748.1 fructose-1-phosphate kinase [Bacillus sp. OV322]